MKFYGIKCPDCGRYQSCKVKKERDYTFTCRTCEHSTKLWKERTRGIGLHVVGPGTAREIREAVAQKNEERGLKEWGEL